MLTRNAKRGCLCVFFHIFGICRTILSYMYANVIVCINFNLLGRPIDEKLT
jgi:TM2 domain-containing membrane protein YozV